VACCTCDITINSDFVVEYHSNEFRRLIMSNRPDFTVQIEDRTTTVSVTSESGIIYIANNSPGSDDTTRVFVKYVGRLELDPILSMSGINSGTEKPL
jgi:hypothetical protein